MRRVCLDLVAARALLDSFDPPHARARQGFTREFLKGEVGTAADLLREVREAVEDVSRGKKVRESGP